MGIRATPTAAYECITNRCRFAVFSIFPWPMALHLNPGSSTGHGPHLRGIQCPEGFSIQYELFDFLPSHRSTPVKPDSFAAAAAGSRGVRATGPGTACECVTDCRRSVKSRVLPGPMPLHPDIRSPSRHGPHLRGIERPERFPFQ